jgi:hypothetical protein
MKNGGELRLAGVTGLGENRGGEKLPRRQKMGKEEGDWLK